MNEFSDFSSFEKRCIICKERKHISSFKRNKKMCKICKECAPNNNLIKCTICGVEKKYPNFQRDSKVYRSCNDCVLSARKEIDKNFKIAFKLLTGISGGNNSGNESKRL